MLQRSVLLVRGGEVGWNEVQAALASMPGIRVVDETDSFATAWEAAQALLPDAVVAAFCIAGSSALPLLARCRSLLPASAIVAIAARLEADDLLAMADIGLSGCLLWHELPACVLRCTLAAAIQGSMIVVSREAAGAYLVADRRRWRPESSMPPLTVREQAILRRMATGMTQRQIAQAEQVSRSTVARVIQSIEDKLGVYDRFALGVKAFQLGLVSAAESTVCYPRQSPVSISDTNMSKT